LCGVFQEHHGIQDGTKKKESTIIYMIDSIRVDTVYQDTTAKNRF